jgi:hypothetical protein
MQKILIAALAVIETVIAAVVVGAAVRVQAMAQSHKMA